MQDKRDMYRKRDATAESVMRFGVSHMPRNNSITQHDILC